MWRRWSKSRTEGLGREGAKPRRAPRTADERRERSYFYSRLRSIHHDRRLHDRDAAGSAIDRRCRSPGPIRIDRFLLTFRRNCRRAASSIVDRFARRTTFMVQYAGFIVGHSAARCRTTPCYAARVVTGAFGGILADVNGDHRRCVSRGSARRATAP